MGDVERNLTSKEKLNLLLKEIIYLDRRIKMSHEGAMQQEKKVDKHLPLTTIFDKFANNKDVTFVYGKPVSYENRAIIPVAKMSYSFGAGSGGETDVNEGEETTLNQGEGGGGHFSVQPLGVYEMTASRVRFKPIIDVKFIAILFTILTLGMTLLLRKK